MDISGTGKTGAKWRCHRSKPLLLLYYILFSHQCQDLTYIIEGNTYIKLHSVRNLFMDRIYAKKQKINPAVSRSGRPVDSEFFAVSACT